MSLVGETLSHYSIDRLLGAGGMGEVYLATDVALGRRVALKVLGANAGAELRERALREARACARLQHPGIVTFYESGEVSPTTFIAMEYVIGRTLRERLMEGPLPLAEAVSLIDAVLDALAHAHASGLLHRDIKPENIMLTESGSVKLLDFGLAKAALTAVRGDDATEAVLSEGQQVLGTLGYMSPEQLRAHELGPEADLFSVGVVLYECLAGRHPFEGETPAARVAALLTQPPRALGSDVPAPLRRIVSRALAKAAADRHASSSELLRDLRSLELHGPGEHFPDSLAVMSFRDTSEGAGDGWIGVAIAESLARDVGRAADLSVVARGEAEAAQREAPDALAAGRSLGCRWVLSGELTRKEDRLALQASLLDVATGVPLGSRSADGTLADLFPLQRQLADWVLERLNHTAPAQPIHGHDLAAHKRFAQGLEELYSLEKGAQQRAAAFFAAAVESDPTHAGALTGLAASTAMRFAHTTDPADLETAAAYARRALASETEAEESRTWMGYILFRQSNLDEAARYLGESMHQSPDVAMTPYLAGCVALARQRVEEAMEHYRTAVELQREPRSKAGNSGAGAWVGLGWSHVELGRFDEAISALLRAVELNENATGPAMPGIGGYLAECHRRRGDASAARAAAMAGLAAVEESDYIYRDSIRAVCLIALGRAALDQDDRDGAAAAFLQAQQHLRGRSRALGGGHLLAQASAGLARARADVSAWREARELFETREGFDFTWLWMCSDDATLFELARSAEALGLTSEAEAYRARALDAGSTEARSQGWSRGRS